MPKITLKPKREVNKKINQKNIKILNPVKYLKKKSKEVKKTKITFSDLLKPTKISGKNKKDLKIFRLKILGKVLTKKETILEKKRKTSLNIKDKKERQKRIVAHKKRLEREKVKENTKQSKK